MQKAFRLLSEMFLESVDNFVRIIEVYVFFEMLDYFKCFLTQS